MLNPLSKVLSVIKTTWTGLHMDKDTYATGYTQTYAVNIINVQVAKQIIENVLTFHTDRKASTVLSRVALVYITKMRNCKNCRVKMITISKLMQKQVFVTIRDINKQEKGK